VFRGFSGLPRWGARGDQLYVADDLQRIVALEVDVKMTFSAGPPEGAVPAGVFPASGFERSLDGTQFIVPRSPADTQGQSSILITRNWSPDRR
jgi:hypothetical protein